MGSQNKKNKNKTVLVDKNIQLDTRKQPYSLYNNPLMYDNEHPVWSFKRISKEDVWVFHTDEFKNIISKLADFETMTWRAIKEQTHNTKGKTNNHLITNLTNFCDKAKDRLEKLQIEELFSLRLGGKTRIYGILQSRVLEILWYDNKHEIYPVSKK